MVLISQICTCSNAIKIIKIQHIVDVSIYYSFQYDLSMQMLSQNKHTNPNVWIFNILIYAHISKMSVLWGEKNSPLAFCFSYYITVIVFWLILGHIGRRDLESREDDISLSAWVSGLRRRFQEERKHLLLYMCLLTL